MYCFFFNDTATTEIYTLSLHDALPIFSSIQRDWMAVASATSLQPIISRVVSASFSRRMETKLIISRWHSAAAADRKSTTSELQSRQYIVCRLLLEKKQNLRSIHLYHPL